MQACDLSIWGSYIPSSNQNVSKEWEQRWLNLLEPLPCYRVEFSLLGRSGSQSSLQLSWTVDELPSLFSMGKSPCSYLQDFQLACTSKVAQIREVKSDNMSGCLICDRVSRTVTEIQHPNPSCHPRNGLMARTTLGCVATDPQGQWMGAKTQQISIIWRVGKYSEASTMYIHPSLPLFHPISSA